ncbi:hypothetical protein D9757_010763 [Collybiopsis confluens]|uniref:Uncharacterized protein n=1 Tax=Collybiopsis confluens TaxID=2823264 RepID=A0A8H5M2P7_9AGAR|nr:hypothetical protein D9757_010763 [Collybiopsis confluens]
MFGRTNTGCRAFEYWGATRIDELQERVGSKDAKNALLEWKPFLVWIVSCRLFLPFSASTPSPAGPSLAPGCDPHPLLRPSRARREQRHPLEGSQATFVSDTTLLIVLADGDVYTVMLAMDGKAASGIDISKVPVGKTECTAAAAVGEEHELVLVGSTQGLSVLFQTGLVEVEVVEEGANGNVDGDADMKTIPSSSTLYYDEDIYGPSSTSGTAERPPTKRHLLINPTTARVYPPPPHNEPRNWN